MAFGASGRIWGDLLPFVRRDIALIANAIAKYEPVSMLARPNERHIARRLLDEKIELVDAALDDIWIRDTGPTFVLRREGELGAIDLNFNGWGEKQEYEEDSKVAAQLSRLAGAQYLRAGIIGEGGGIEVDGNGTAIVTESCFVNRNRNPGMSKSECTSQLKTLLGLRKVIWLPGMRGKDITDGHTDFYARFAGPGAVIAGLESDRDSFDYDVTREHLEILQKSRDADGKRLRVIPLESPRRIRRTLETEDFAAGYINFYVVNGAVIVPEFGDNKMDSNCRDILSGVYPKRHIVQLNIDAVAAGGGGIHCTTQQEPEVLG